MGVAPSTLDKRPLEKRLAAYGCPNPIRLDVSLCTQEQLDYLDLLPKQSNHLPMVNAVAEHQGTALLYVVDSISDVKCDPGSLAHVRNKLANRSDPAWLGVVRSGTLEIFPIEFKAVATAQPVAIIEEASETAPLFFQSLVHGTFGEGQKPEGTDYVFRKIFKLLTEMLENFIPQNEPAKIDPLDVLSMAGRALFFRFLIDRKIVLPNECDKICPAASGDLKDAFTSAEKAAQTSAWLDETFNGDFLPLIDEKIPAEDRSARETAYLRFYKRIGHTVGNAIFRNLFGIVHGWRTVNGVVQPEFDWGDLDFAHIPIGVLSQVYESFSHRADPLTARDTSVHYTPRTLASLMVDETFAATKNKGTAKVLDSACGAGIFLVLAFRRLFREQWHGKERPKTAGIQDILYKQLCGFDVSESALRLAALSLYITAIELNATPRPPKALKFPRNLRGAVLHRFGCAPNDDKLRFPLGSLSAEVSLEFNGTFDIVIGNPPWTRLRDEKVENRKTAEKKSKSDTDSLNYEFTKIGRNVLEARGLSDLAKRYENPDKNPDIPFLWRAMDWAKSDGVIALAMHPRLFLRTSGKGVDVWRSILKSLTVTGILNGIDLRKTAVWEGMDAPFCVLFARNAKPKSDHRFYFVSPMHEPLNECGRFRIDYESAQSIGISQVEEHPWLLKTLAFGTWLDVEVMQELTKPSLRTLADFWRDWDKKGIRTGQGYIQAVELPQKSSDFLANLLVFEPPNDSFLPEFSSLKTYGEHFGKNAKGQSCALRPRRLELYEPPLVIVPKAPGENRQSPKAYFVEREMAFSQSYYGYSCKGHPESATLASLIYLLAHSTLFRYYSLMVSVSQGVDYMIFTKRDFDNIPFPDLTKLSLTTKKTIRSIAQRLRQDAQKPWRELDELIFKLYDLDAEAAQVAEDTLFATAAYRKAGKEALEETNASARAPFVQQLMNALEPYFDVCGDHVAVRDLDHQPSQWAQPWYFLALSRESDAVPIDRNLLCMAMAEANDRGCSRIIVHAPGRHGLLLGLLNQRRWWTATRARLCAQHIIRERLGAFGLEENA